MSEAMNRDVGVSVVAELETGVVSLLSLADQVRARLARICFWDWMRRGQVAVPLLGIAAILFLRVFGHWNSGEIWAALGLLATWVLGGVLWSLCRRPDRFQALMVWDERSGAKDVFASALFFAQQEEALNEGEKGHLKQAFSELSQAREQQRLEQCLPLPAIKPLFVMIVVLLLFALVPLLRPGITAGDAKLSAGMIDEAHRQGLQLADKVAAMKVMEDLSEKEKEAVKKLQEMVNAASEDLKKSEGKSARDVLETLEQRARVAEKLAKKLGSSTGAWASAEMLKEMSQHADFADLAAALKDKNAQLSSAQSDRLEGLLENHEIKAEVEQRMATALSRTMDAANDEDKSKPVGEHVGNAAIKMESKQSKPAARDFGRLADHFRKMAQREAAQKKMQELANQLREAGSKISGSKLQQMKKLTANKGGAKMPKGMKPLQAGKSGASMAHNPIKQQNVSQSQLPIPGIQNQPLGAGQMQKGGASPVPGSKNAQQGKAQGQGKSMAMGQGKGKGKKSGAPGLMAPVPGQGQGMKAPGAGLGNQQGNGTSSGGAPVASAGGQEVGNGTTGLGSNKTASQKAVRDSTVAAQINADGESSMRSVQGETQQEMAQRERQQAVVDFIKVEEQALDERALPLSRRDHVRKYFTALRKRFEEEK